MAASSAWPKVWPRLSSARSPVSRSSRATIAGLGAAALGDRVLARGAAGKDLVAIGLQPVEEFRIAQHAVFDDFGIAGAELALRQRVEHLGVGDHQHRLMKRAEQVLAVRRVDAGLAADGGVHLRQQRRRYLHEIDAATDDRGGEAGEIADHAAAERHDQIVALDLRGDQPLADLLEHGVALGRLAFADDDARRCDAGGGKRRFHGCEPMRGDAAVGNDRGARARPQGGDAFAERTQHAAADDDVVGAFAQPDIDDGRRRAE